MKSNNLKELTKEELQSKITSDKKSLINYKLNHAVSPLENPAVIKSTRRSIAKLLTELNKRK